MASLSRPPYGSHSGCRHACQKRPTSQCGWTRRAAAQTVVAQRVPGRAGNALLRDRGNESLRRRLSEGAPPRGAHAGDGFIVGGSCSRADAALGSGLLVVKSGGKEVSHIEKNSDVHGSTWSTHSIAQRRARSCGNLQSRSIFLLLLAGVALQDVLLPSLSPIFLLTQIFVRTDPGDEPDGPRRLRSGSSCETCDLDHSDRHSTFRLGGGVLSCVRTSPLPRTAQEREG